MTNGGGVGAVPGGGAGWDFFVSYSKADRSWAEWIAWQLEEVGGFRVLVQAWDMVPGTSFVVGMQSGVTRARRTIAVLSGAYARSQFGAAEWQAAWSADPAGFERKLLVVRVEDCARPGLLGQVVSFDLFDQPEDAARDELVRWATLAVSGGRAKPATAPSFPGDFPGAVKPAPVFPSGAASAAASSTGGPDTAPVGGSQVGNVSAPGGGIAVGVNFGQIFGQRGGQQRGQRGAEGDAEQNGAGSS